MSEFKSPNAPGRPFSRISSEAGEPSTPSPIYSGGQQPDALQQDTSLTLCNGSQKFDATANDSYEWTPTDDASTSDFKRINRHPGDTSFENPKSIWENSYGSIKGANPQSSRIWGFRSPSFSHSNITKDYPYDTPLNRVSQTPYNIGFNYGSGVPMSPVNKDMNELGQQMIDHVLSNSPNNACMYSDSFVVILSIYSTFALLPYFFLNLFLCWK